MRIQPKYILLVSDAIIPLLEMTIPTMTKYYDVDEWEEDPLKIKIHSYYERFHPTTSKNYFIMTSQNFAVRYDSSVSELQDFHNDSFINVRFDTTFET